MVALPVPGVNVMGDVGDNVEQVWVLFSNYTPNIDRRRTPNKPVWNDSLAGGCITSTSCGRLGGRRSQRGTGVGAVF